MRFVTTRMTFGSIDGGSMTIVTSSAKRAEMTPRRDNSLHTEMRTDHSGEPEGQYFQRLPLVIDTIVFLVAEAVGVAGDFGRRTPLQVVESVILITVFFALGCAGRRWSKGLWFAIMDVAVLVALAFVPVPAGVIALLVIGSSFRIGTSIPIGGWWVFVLIDAAVLAIVLVRGTHSEHSHTWVFVGGFSSVALVFVQAIILYANSARRAYGALTEAHEELRRHAERVGELSALRERERIALDIHDALGHELTVLTMQLETAAHVLGTHPASAYLSRAHAGSLRVLANVRRSVRAISADPLERDPLDIAIERICRNFEDGSGIALHLEAKSLPAFSASTTTHIVNVVREALTNAMRHAGARSIRVETSADKAAVTIAVEDDGCGFVPDLNISGHGLRGMRSRAAAIGASLEIRSIPGSGSIVRMRLPIALVHAIA
jgi:signal transduction histidine kinase